AIEALVKHGGQRVTPTPRGLAVRAGWPVARRWQLERERVASVRWVQGPWLARFGAVRLVVHAVRAADASAGVAGDLSMVLPWLSWPEAEALGVALGVSPSRALDAGTPLAHAEGHRRRAQAVLAAVIGGVALAVGVQPGLGGAWALAWLAWGIWRGARAHETRWGADEAGWWRRVAGPWAMWEVAVGARATRSRVVTPPWLAGRGVTRLGFGSPGRWVNLGLVEAEAAETAMMAWARSAVRRRAFGASLEQNDGARGGEQRADQVAVQQREQHAEREQPDAGVGAPEVPAGGEDDLGRCEEERDSAARQHADGHSGSLPVERELPPEVDR
ncbi:MAG: Bacterial domain, partial [Pseudomonadota bacterium]